MAGNRRSTACVSTRCVAGRRRHFAVIEAAAGSRSKLKFEPDDGAFMPHTVPPFGQRFPYAFGFLPSTLGDDGDRSMF